MRQEPGGDMSEDTSVTTSSDRYELDDFVEGEAPQTQQLLTMAGVVLLVVLLLIALGFPFLYL